METLLYDLSRLFLWPVLCLIAASLAYTLVMLGAFAVEARQRRQGSTPSALLMHAHNLPTPPASDDLELWIMLRLEWLRIISRTAPMLGLIATMIPMGPALLALGSGDAQAVGRNMVSAFSAVILALLAAGLAFFILTVRRRWLLQDLRLWEHAREAN